MNASDARKASDVQGILGTDWLDGKTPEQIVRERRDGKP